MVPFSDRPTDLLRVVVEGDVSTMVHDRADPSAVSLACGRRKHVVHQDPLNVKWRALRGLGTLHEREGPQTGEPERLTDGTGYHQLIIRNRWLRCLVASDRILDGRALVESRTLAVNRPE